MTDSPIGAALTMPLSSRTRARAGALRLAGTPVGSCPEAPRCTPAGPRAAPESLSLSKRVDRAHPNPAAALLKVYAGPLSQLSAEITMMKSGESPQ
jgi:hypothetical protein